MELEDRLLFLAEHWEESNSFFMAEKGWKVSVLLRLREMIIMRAWYYSKYGHPMCSLTKFEKIIYDKKEYFKNGVNCLKFKKEKK